jgi:hypothetical protein
VTAPRTRWLKNVGIVAGVFLVLAPLSVSFPGDGLDPSWGLVIEQAFLRGAQWGRDIVFTFGPLGYHYQRIFHPELAAGILAAASIRALLIGIGIALLLRGAGVWRTAAALVAVGASLPFSQDSAYFLVPLLAVLLHFSRPAPPLAYLLAVAAYCGFAALVKTTFALLAVALLLIVDIDRLCHRRLPVATPLCVAVALAAYLASGQPPAALPQFLATSLDVASGYSRAMSVFSAVRAVELAAFLTASATLLGLLLADLRRDGGLRTRSGLLLLLAVAAFWFMTYKAGFTRHDLHTLTAWSCLGIAGTLLAGARFAADGHDSGSARLLMVAALGTALLAPIRLAVAPGFSLAGMAVQTVYDGPRDTLVDAARLLTDPSGWLAEKRGLRTAALARIRDRNPLPDGLGSLDTIPSLQGALVAADLDGTAEYRPRPMFQEYSTYTAALIDANAGFLAGDDAPDTVLLAPGSIDNRYPSLAEGPLWPLLMRRYAPAGLIGPYHHLDREIDVLVLRRRAGDADIGDRSHPSLALAPGATRALDDLRGPVLATLDLPLSAAGRLLTLLHQTPMVEITVTLADGSQRTHRLIPEIARAGFIMSPYMADATDAQALFDAASTGDDPHRVTALRVDVPAIARWAFADRLTLGLRRLR